VKPTESDGDKNKGQGEAGPNICMKLSRTLVNKDLQLSEEEEEEDFA